MSVLHQLNSLRAIFRNYLTQARQRENPHRQIVKVLAVAIRSFADSKTALSAKNTLDVGDNALSFIEELVLLQFVVERDQQNNAEGIGPQVSHAIGPDALFAHPVEFGQYLFYVRGHVGS
jgi:hypothetical protein